MTDEPKYGIPPLRAAYRWFRIKEEMEAVILERFRADVPESLLDLLRRLTAPESPGSDGSPASRESPHPE